MQVRDARTGSRFWIFWGAMSHILWARVWDHIVRLTVRSERPGLEISDSVDEIITSSEDLKLETKADANSEMDETMKPKLNVELKKDAGQGSIDSETIR